MRLIRCVCTTMVVYVLYGKLMCVCVCGKLLCALVTIRVRSVQSIHLYTRYPADWSMCDDQDVGEVPMCRPLGSSLC